MSHISDNRNLETIAFHFFAFVFNVVHRYCVAQHARLSIKPKTRLNKIDALKEIIRAWGLNPEEILIRNTLADPHRTLIEKSQLENNQRSQLTAALRQHTLKEILENQPQKV